MQDLHDMDSRLNTAYKTLLSSTKEDQAALRAEQRNWIKTRNVKCGTEDRGGDRSAWIKTLSADPHKALCVIRETQGRVALIEQASMKKSAEKSTARSDAIRTTYLADFFYVSPLSRNSGKWYFEVNLDRAGIAKSQEHIAATWPTVFWMGCSTTNSDYDIGTLAYIHRDENRGLETIGFALDFDEGRAYIHRNGKWEGGSPENSKGKSIERGQSYVCATDSTIAVRPLLNNKSVSINFGESPFKFSAPTNFKPFHRGFLWIQAGESKDRKIYFDYRQLQENPVADIAFVKEEFATPRDSGEGIPSHTSRIAQIHVDCATEQITERALILLAKDNTAVGQIHRPRDTDHRPGLDTIGGRFARSVCFLKTHQISLPPPDLQDRWDEMQSPVASIKIAEASAQRQYRNGWLFVKQMNETESPTSIFGKSSNKLVAISALDCKDITSSQMVGIRYDNSGTAIGIDFFMAKNAIRLEKNRQRFTDACIAFDKSSTRQTIDSRQ